MALVLKSGKTYSPDISNQYGMDLTGSDFYAVIDDITYNKKQRQCSFPVDIYSNASARENDLSIVARIMFNFNEDIFDSEIGNNGIDVTTAYEKAVLVLIDWESDE